MTDIEISILDFIQKYFRTAVGDVLMPFITKFGDAGLFWIAIGILLLVWKKAQKDRCAGIGGAFGGCYYLQSYFEKCSCQNPSV